MIQLNDVVEIVSDSSFRGLRGYVIEITDKKHFPVVVCFPHHVILESIFDYSELALVLA